MDGRGERREELRDVICKEFGYDVNVTLKEALSQAARDLRKHVFCYIITYSFIS